MLIDIQTLNMHLTIQFTIRQQLTCECEGIFKDKTLYIGLITDLFIRL